ncbi:MAG TPA: hypothetical protein VIP09_14800 [Dehalococcoidia bacterium]
MRTAARVDLVSSIVVAAFGAFMFVFGLWAIIAPVSRRSSPSRTATSPPRSCAESCSSSPVGGLADG